MIPRLVTEISPCDSFCDGVAVAVEALAAGIGYSSRLMRRIRNSTQCNVIYNFKLCAQCAKKTASKVAI